MLQQPSKKLVVVTGAAGFIASRVCEMLLENVVSVVGLDNMNDYFDVCLKEYRLSKLTNHPNFVYYKADIEKMDNLKPISENMILDLFST